MTRRSLIGMPLAALISWHGASLARGDGISGQRVRFLIGNEGAGGYEAYARLFARHLALALPDARVTVEMVPTADGRLAAKQIFESPAGSLVIGLFESALLYAQVAGEDDAVFDLARFNWLGKLAVDERVVVASRLSGLKSIPDLAKSDDPVVFPASTIASRSSFESYILNTLLDVAIKPVAGYDAAQRSLAMISGEAQVVVGSYSSSRKLVEDEGAVVILRLNEVPRPEAPTSAPLLRSLVQQPAPGVVDLIETTANLGRWIAAPPSASPDDVRALRAAFDAVVASDAFLAEAAELQIPIDALPGMAVQEMVRSLHANEQALRAELNAAVACGKRRAAGDSSC